MFKFLERLTDIICIGFTIKEAVSMNEKQEIRAKALEIAVQAISGMTDGIKTKLFAKAADDKMPTAEVYSTIASQFAKYISKD
jgi:hypothetical protein